MSSIALSPGTMADDATVGTVAWTNPDNAKVSDNVYAVFSTFEQQTPYDREVKIVKSDGTIGTTNKALTTTNWTTTDTYIPYGSSTDLWGETWTAENISDVDFGVVLAVQQNSGGDGGYPTSHYLKATNFGFSIPTGATINGILVEIERKKLFNIDTENGLVDHIRITVYFSELLRGSVTGIQSMTGVGSITL